MFEPIACARFDPGDFEDRRHVVLIINAIEIGIEMLRDVHLNDVCV
jgi:hypothetical protein